MNTADGSRFEIRPYCPPDRRGVWELVADTSFFGAPVEAFIEDRSLFCAAFAAYYTDYEAAYEQAQQMPTTLLWVAEHSGTLVGYLLGCDDTRRKYRTMRRSVLPKLVLGVLGGHYWIGRKTWRYLLRLAADEMSRSRPHFLLDEFPAHFHIGVKAEMRRLGIGRALLESGLEACRRRKVTGVHLVTTDRNTAACHLYEKLGFRLLDVHPTRLWQGLVKGQVESRVYGLHIEQT